MAWVGVLNSGGDGSLPMRNTGGVIWKSSFPHLLPQPRRSPAPNPLLPEDPPCPSKYLDLLKTIGGKMIYIKALHKKVINANSSEEIASTDGNGPFATNASGCADGNYGMCVNMQALASRANCTAELSLH